MIKEFLAFKQHLFQDDDETELPLKSDTTPPLDYYVAKVSKEQGIDNPEFDYIINKYEKYDQEDIKINKPKKKINIDIFDIALIVIGFITIPVMFTLVIKMIIEYPITSFPIFLLTVLLWFLFNL